MIIISFKKYFTTLVVRKTTKIVDKKKTKQTCVKLLLQFSS